MPRVNQFRTYETRMRAKEVERAMELGEEEGEELDNSSDEEVTEEDFIKLAKGEGGKKAVEEVYSNDEEDGGSSGDDLGLGDNQEKGHGSGDSMNEEDDGTGQYLGLEDVDNRREKGQGSRDSMNEEDDGTGEDLGLGDNREKRQGSGDSMNEAARPKPYKGAHRMVVPLVRVDSVPPVQRRSNKGDSRKNVDEVNPRKRAKRLRRALRLSLARKTKPGKDSSRHKQRQCPMCPKTVYNIPRHLRGCHGVQPDRSLVIGRKITKGKGHRCPVKGCEQTIVRVDKHLRQFHKLAPPNFDRIMQEHKKFLQETEEEDLFEEPEELVDDTVQTSEDDEEEDQEVVLPEKAQRLMRKFRRFLMSIDGGLKSPKSADQHVRQIEQIWVSLGEGCRERYLKDPARLANRWLTPTITGKELRPGTILSYISSLKMMVRYFTHKGDDLRRMEACLQGWAASLKREKNRRRQEVLIKDVGCMITPEEVKKVDECVFTQRAVSILEEIATGTKTNVDCDEYQVVSGFLTMVTMLNTGHRSGVLRNMSLENFRQATHITTEEGNREHVVPVTNHKTSHVGAVYVSMSDKFYAFFHTFIQHIRNPLVENIFKVAPNPNDTVFVKYYTGKSYNSSEFHTMMNSRYQYILGRSISCKNVRQRVATEMWRRHPDSRGMLARQLGHSVQTEGNYYTLTEPDRVAQLAGTIRQTVRDGQDNTSANVEQEPELTQEDEDTTAEDSSAVEGPSQRQTTFNMARTTVGILGSRRSFRDENLDALKRMCNTSILEGKPVKAKEMKALLNVASPEDRELLSSFSTKQLVDRVRLIIKSKK